MTDLNAALNTVPLATWLSFATATVIPYLSALVTKRPSAMTGIVTALLAVASGFLSDWASSPSHFDWKVALGTSFITWFLGTKWHDKVLKGTDLEATLYAAFGGDAVNGDPTTASQLPATPRSADGGAAPNRATGGGCPARPDNDNDDDDTENRHAATSIRHHPRHADSSVVAP